MSHGNRKVKIFSTIFSYLYFWYFLYSTTPRSKKKKKKSKLSAQQDSIKKGNSIFACQIKIWYSLFCSFFWPFSLSMSSSYYQIERTTYYLRMFRTSYDFSFSTLLFLITFSLISLLNCQSLGYFTNIYPEYISWFSIKVFSISWQNGSDDSNAENTFYPNFIIRKQ